jgi:membrane protein implicated in regulation of membrane protease activity
MKQSIARIATVVWVIGLVLTGLMLSVPPANVLLYIGLACIAIIPLVFGSRRYQIFGIVAAAVSLMLAYWEYEAGLRVQARMERLKNNHVVQQTNMPANKPQNQQ